MIAGSFFFFLARGNKFKWLIVHQMKWEIQKHFYVLVEKTFPKSEGWCLKSLDIQVNYMTS